MKLTSYCPISILLFIFIISTSTEALAQKLNNAQDYLAFLNNEHRKIAEDMWSYTSASAHGKNARKVENKRKELIKTTLTAKNNIAKMPEFEGDKALRDSMVSYLNLCYLVLNDDYSKIVDLEEIAEQSYDLMEAYMTAQEKANEKMEQAGKMAEKEFNSFAARHNITLLENKDKLSKKLEAASGVFKYYNKVYLIFFKSYKQEAYFLNALQKNDVNGMEQNKSALLSVAEQGIKSLDTMKTFKNDPSLKTICKQILDFHKQEASQKAPMLIDFFLKKDKFEKTKASFDLIAPNNRTKQDVDNYNKAIAEYNKASTQFNATNQELFNRRSNLNNTWENAVQSFFARHIPAN
jgi:hypothetical protein